MSRLRQELDEIDRREEARMYPLTPSDGPCPYYLPGQDLLNAIENVARGLAEGTIQFFYGTHLIIVGEWRWLLGKDFALWRKAREYASQLERQRLLDIDHYDEFGIKYIRRLT
jgi:hypothetical protein